MISSFPRRRTAVFLLLVFVAPAARAQDLSRAVESSYPTNLHLLTEAATSAVHEFFIGFHAPPGATLVVKADADHQANWFLESLLLTELADYGYQAYLQEEPLGPEIPPRLREGQDTLAVADSLTVDEAALRDAINDPEPESNYVLRYRVAEFGLSYPNSYRRSPLGSRHVERHASVALQGHLVEGAREKVLWVGQGNAQRFDVVPAGKLPLLEGESYPFTQPTLQTGSLGSLVEPALVIGIVAGLIYLFYTNQD